MKVENKLTLRQWRVRADLTQVELAEMMEALQYLLKMVNQTKETDGLEIFNKQVLFSYNNRLCTGDFYKELNSSEQIEVPTIQSEKSVTSGYNFKKFKSGKLTDDFLLGKLLHSEKYNEFHHSYVGQSNLARPAFFLNELTKFVAEFSGLPTTNCIYNWKDHESALNLPFVITKEDASFTPVSLINVD